MRNQQFWDASSFASEQWDILFDLFKKALIQYAPNPSSNKINKKKNKKKEDIYSDPDRLADATLQLLSVLCLICKHDTEDMLTGDDKHSVTTILTKFLRKGYHLDDNTYNTDTPQDTHPVELHTEALNTFAWILFVANNQRLILQFLENVSQYFASTDNEDEDEDEREEFVQKHAEVAACSIRIWTFLLSTLDDEDIHQHFDYRYAKI